MRDKTILLVIGGGIAAYKSLELIRLLKKRGARLRVIITRGGQQFVTPLSAATLAGEKAFTDLFDLTDELEIGHIRLAREADLIVVAPATADLMARMAAGIADDLATTCLLAADSDILLAPAMNPVMWDAPATRRNRRQLAEDGVRFVGPAAGDMACGETGTGRMSEPIDIVAAIEHHFALDEGQSLAGRHVLVTSGPTVEPIDPVRFIANRSSGKQGHAIAAAARALGARVTLVSGPVQLPPPAGVDLVDVTTAVEMLAAVEAALPADILVAAAAVADWRVDAAALHKLKKKGGTPPSLKLVENPDILRTLSQPGERRSPLVIGFAAETEELIGNAKKKLVAKGCDWIVANDVSPGTDTFGGSMNRVHLVSRDGVEDWPLMDKDEVARRLMARAAERLGGKGTQVWV
jgi:phosphopantothenoylcysteine decarboxylase/phosphopantothenate--cysteine ligase